MEKSIKISKNYKRLFHVWVVSLIYYNVVECLLVIDRLWHIDIIRYTYMDMRAAFALFPIISYLVFSLYRINSKKIYYSILFVLCFVYSFVVAFFNLSLFPIKTWAVWAVFFSSVFVCVEIDKRGVCIAVNKKDQFENPVWAALLSILMVIVIIITALCHSYMV